MLKTLIEKKIDNFEKNYDYSMDYARTVLGLGVGVYKRFFDATQLGGYHGELSPSVRFAAQLVAIAAGDCGPCVQLVAQLAQDAKMPATEIAAVLEGRYADLPDDAALSARFASALLCRAADLSELREEVKERWGLAGQVAIAYTIITASMYPTLKYAIGYGEACSRVFVENGAIEVAPSLLKGALPGAA